MKVHTSLISGFCRDVDEICGLLGYYAYVAENCVVDTFKIRNMLNTGKGKGHPITYHEDTEEE
jgi:hypothetical protein